MQLIHTLYVSLITVRVVIVTLFWNADVPIILWNFYFSSRNFYPHSSIFLMRTIHRTKVFPDVFPPKWGVRIVHKCALYTRLYGIYWVSMRIDRSRLVSGFNLDTIVM